MTKEQETLLKALIAKKHSMMPCDEGDYVHIYMRPGCYKVLAAHIDGFMINLCGKNTILTWSQYKCHKGGANPTQNLRDFAKLLISIQAK